jgi:hypothetical protein
MTRRSPNAPVQVELIARLTRKIDDARDWVFITDHEQHTKQKILEGEWRARLYRFTADPENGITEQETKWVAALLTKRYAEYLPRTVVEKLTRILTPPVQAKPSREEALAKVKRDIRKVRP